MQPENLEPVSDALASGLGDLLTRAVRHDYLLYAPWFVSPSEAALHGSRLVQAWRLLFEFGFGAPTQLRNHWRVYWHKADRTGRHALPVAARAAAGYVSACWLATHGALIERETVMVRKEWLLKTLDGCDD